MHETTKRKPLTGYEQQAKTMRETLISGYAISKPKSEDELQIQTAELFKKVLKPNVVAYHVPNGGLRHIRVAAKLKKMGTLAGVSDWVFDNGLAFYLELKVGKGKQTSFQIEFERRVTANGRPYRIARTLDEAYEIVKEWGLFK